MLTLRALEYALGRVDGDDWATALHFPLTAWLGGLFGSDAGRLEAAVVAVATIKILISMAWAITIGLNATMGVAWHRFLAFFNIWFKRHPDGRTSLGALQPIAVRGVPVDFENVDEPGRGRRARRRQGRGLHLEGPARLLDLHRVRPLPVAVPGLEHRQAAVAEACS
ncbi:hypothetical protein GCM10025868_24990 [Angustibacter aerolatus]|uniref:Uncharacterized protein n=1 Tax=Angustibacter aerolatus TaxID=1162965 RepID=A0ABQ6JIS1_9ACTN|nr:hypothetical protein [Angustibacter aerolatus]GMA87249.1 hypothetical protein GCM10025868_24990 [Angustibacter aerolatus]